MISFRILKLIISACYPFDEYDPFILNEKPHIFFAGNQPEYQTKLKPGAGIYKIQI